MADRCRKVEDGGGAWRRHEVDGKLSGKLRGAREELQVRGIGVWRGSLREFLGEGSNGGWWSVSAHGQIGMGEREEGSWRGFKWRRRWARGLSVLREESPWRPCAGEGKAGAPRGEGGLRELLRSGLRTTTEGRRQGGEFQCTQRLTAGESSRRRRASVGEGMGWSGHRQRPSNKWRESSDELKSCRPIQKCSEV